MITYNALISTCERGQQSEQALQFFKVMQHQGLTPDVIINNALISACTKGKQAVQALGVFAVMREQGFTPVAFWLKPF